MAWPTQEALRDDKDVRKSALNYGHTGHAMVIMENALVITTMCKGA